ncbi:ZmpA/ZmpB/ZmpC family metallo-endopeptidase [Lactococcus garvieae]|uniref:ZmpA/ZmpB/ZmpC family metallo-endopeptidase n=1 Tax=Lactococcus garvieae TaxID=1363 RepID=UPI001F609339|nr:ZmpA/ZmpB/ZmpC family metallo-endopeptidase [Lactococcus garvieae]MCI3861477.1 hypothetical protein [Lactococcus garvieae]
MKKKILFTLSVFLIITVLLCINTVDQVFGAQEKNEEVVIIAHEEDIKEEQEGERIVYEISEFIEESSFSDMINVFSDSLFEIVPERDTFEGEKYEITDLDKVYENQIKDHSTEIARLLISVNSWDKFDEKEVKEQVILLSYFMRWGTFSDGSTFWEELYTTDSTLLTSEEIKKLNRQFIDYFEEDPVKYLSSKEVNKTFENAFKSIEKNWTYKQSVEEYLLRKKNISDCSEWFYKIFPGKIYKDHYKGTRYDIGIWNRGNTFNNFLPYLLTQSKNSNLMIGETRGEIIFTSPANYNNDQKEAEKVLFKAMKALTNNLETYDRTIEDKEIMNVDKLMTGRAMLDHGRNWLDPDDSLSYEVYRLSGYTATHGSAQAVGGAGQIVMQEASLDDSATIVHELAHELNQLFNADGEYYSYYVENERRNNIYLNVYADNENIFINDGVIANSSCINLQNKASLMNYAKNIEDMAYVLDIAVATRVLELPIEEQVRYIKLVSMDGENGTVSTEYAHTAQVKDLTIEELRKLNIKSIDDLIDHDAIIMEPEDNNRNIMGHSTTTTYACFSLINGKPDPHHRRIINTLLAQNGWEAFKIFNSTYNEVKKKNESKGLSEDELNGIASLAALREVYKDDNLTYRSLMKKRYHEVTKRLEHEGLLDQSYQEFLNSFPLSRLDTFYDFKTKEMYRYLGLSQEFSKSVFGLDETLFLNVSTYTELYEVVKNNPNAYINITNDILVEGIYESQELPEFCGTLNGQGHTISKAQQGLFEKINGAVIKNLVISESHVDSIAKVNVGGLANCANKSIIRNVHFVDSTLNVKGSGELKPFVGGLIGDGISSLIYDSSVQGVELSGSYVGGIIGRANEVNILNSYTTGKISNSFTGDFRVGGLIGNGYNKTSVNNAYTTMEVQGGNGILGSEYDYGNKAITINNTLSLASVLDNNKFKFYDFEPVKEWKNNYEVVENSGKSSKGIPKLDVTDVSQNEINEEFFQDTLKFGKESIWQTSNTDFKNNLPALKNDDPRYTQDDVRGWIKITLPTTVVFESEDKKTIRSPKNYEIKNESDFPVKVDITSYNIMGGAGVPGLTELNIKRSLGYQGNKEVNLVLGSASVQNYPINTEFVRLANKDGVFGNITKGDNTTNFGFTGKVDKDALSEKSNYVESKLSFKFTALRMDGQTIDEASVGLMSNN